MLQEKIVVRLSALGYHGILTSDCAASNNTETENDLESNNDAEDKTLHRIARVHDILEM
jgi:hypothetical protein